MGVISVVSVTIDVSVVDGLYFIVMSLFIYNSSHQNTSFTIDCVVTVTS